MMSENSDGEIPTFLIVCFASFFERSQLSDYYSDDDNNK